MGCDTARKIRSMKRGPDFPHTPEQEALIREHMKTVRSQGIADMKKDAVKSDIPVMES